MKELYIDSEFKVHTENADGRTAVETDAFDDMPKQVIECHIYVPKGESYTKPDGATVHGEFIQPFVTEKELDNAQREYERQLLAAYQQQNEIMAAEMQDMKDALNVLNVEFAGGE